jgi:hypothetical protein
MPLQHPLAFFLTDAMRAFLRQLRARSASRDSVPSISRVV